MSVIDTIIREVCETDPADPANCNSVCIKVDDLRLILESCIGPVAAPSPSASSVPIYQAKTKGYTAWTDCSEDAFTHMRNKPAIFDTQIVYAAPPANPAPSVPPDRKAFDRAWYRYDMYPTEYRDDGEIKAYVDPDTEKAWRVCSFLILQANGATK